jgi:hypothetical protein
MKHEWGEQQEEESLQVTGEEARGKVAIKQTKM